jgi:predicted transcriptional regulator
MRLRRKQDKIPSESECEEMIEGMIQKGYIAEMEDGRLHITSKGDDWFYSDAWTSEERRMVMGNNDEK